MMKKEQNEMNILIATDFSEASENAIDYTVNFFLKQKSLKVEFLLIHAFKPLVPYTNYPVGSIPVMENRDLEALLKERLQKRVELLSKRVTIDSIFEYGALPEVVHGILEKRPQDLIVMGSRMKNGFQRFTLGTNTMEVALSSPIPVLAVPVDAESSKMNQVVLATDFQPLEITEDSLTFLKKFINNTKPEFSVLHVFEKDPGVVDFEGSMKETLFHQYFSSMKHDHHAVVSNDTFAGIEEFIEGHQPDLLIAIPRERNFFERIFHRSITEKMVYHTKLPILILR